MKKEVEFVLVEDRASTISAGRRLAVPVRSAVHVRIQRGGLRAGARVCEVMNKFVVSAEVAGKIVVSGS